MGLLRAVVWCLVVLLILVPTVRLAPSAGDHVSHHASMKSSRASSGVGRTTAATPSVVAVLPILTPESLDVPGARDRLVSVDPTAPFVPPRG
jgi:hypothetical protein